MKYILLLSFVLILTLVKCKDNSTNPIDTHQIWPLKVGNFWSFRITTYDTLGGVSFSTIDTVIVYRDSTYKTGKIYYFKTLANGNFTFQDNAISNLSDGYNELTKVNDSLVANLIYKFPGNPGDTFISNGKPMVIESVNESIKVTAGNFVCYKYVAEENFDYQYIKQIVYLCPGIGEIVTELYQGNNKANANLETKIELLSYKLN